MIATVENSRTAASIPAVNLDWRRREYTAPNQDWTLVLHSSFEWHMGATGWKASLLRAGKDVSRRHKGILRIGGTEGFQCPDDFQPWAFDSRVLAFVTWRTEHPILLYELERSSFVEVHSGKAFPRSVQSAPDLDRLLISFSTYGAVYDQRGVLRFTVPWQVPDSEAPFVFWTRGGRFLWLGRESPDSATLIRVYSGLDGALIAAQPLDPADAVPYDRQRYRNISRRTFTLRRGRGLWAVGSLLDCWNQVRFDPASNRLLLSVLRPVSEPHQGAPGPVCDVEERWVEATITLP